MDDSELFVQVDTKEFKKGNGQGRQEFGRSIRHRWHITVHAYILEGQARCPEEHARYNCPVDEYTEYQLSLHVPQAATRLLWIS